MAYSDRTNAALNVALRRQYNTPLDVSSVFSTIADLDAYANQNKDYIPEGFTANDPETKFLQGINPYSYVGQIVSVEDTGKAYIITAVGKENGSYKELGADFKDAVVQSGEIVISNVNDDLFVGAIAGETYLKLIIANDADNPVFIPVGDLINFDIGGKKETNTTITELFKEEGRLYAKSDVKVQQQQDNIISIVAGTGSGSGLYTPDIAITKRDDDLALTIADNTALVVAQIVKDSNKPQTISEDIIEVVTKDILMADSAITNSELPKGLIDPNKVLVEQLIWTKSADGTELEPASSVQKTLADVLVPAHVDYHIEKNEESGEDFVIFQDGHAGLITPEEKFKLEKLVIDADGSIGISGTISADNVIDLDDRVIKVITGAEKTADWTPIESGAQVNKIESIVLGGVDTLPINDKQVAIPIATAQSLGVIKSAEAVNKIQVAGATGEAEVYSLSTDKLVQGTQELILYGGDSGATPLVPTAKVLNIQHDGTTFAQIIKMVDNITTWNDFIATYPTITSVDSGKTATLSVLGSGDVAIVHIDGTPLKESYQGNTVYGKDTINWENTYRGT